MISWFRVLYPIFVRRFQAIMLYFDDTLDDEDDLMIFDELEVKLTAVTFVTQLFLKISTDNEFTTCVTCHERQYMRTVTHQTNSYSSSLSFSHLNLSIIRENNHRIFSE